MKLIAVLLAFAALKYLSLGYAHRYKLFNFYAAKEQSVLKFLHSGWLSCIIILFPGLFLMFCIQYSAYYFLSGYIGGIVNFFIDLVVIWYCLWPFSLEDVLEDRLVQEKKSLEIEQSLAPDTTAVVNQQIVTAERSRVISEEVLVGANEKIFSVLFWFFALGPFGALMYRMIQLLVSNQRADQSRNSVFHVAKFLQSLLDWFPARISALTYVVAGDFVPGFAEWSKDVWSGISANTAVLVRSGIAACGFNPDDSTHSDAEESRVLNRMVERALIVWLVLLGIFELGRWLY